MKELIAQKNWFSVTSENDVDCAFEEFFKIINNNIKQVSTNKIINYKTKKKEWITSSLIKSIKVRDNLYKKYRRNENIEKDNTYYIETN